MKQIALRSVLPLVILTIGAFVMLRVAGSAQELGSLPRIENAWLLAPALAAQAATIVAYVALWRVLVFAMDPARPSWADSSAAFVCSWLARHAPTGVPYVAGKVVLGERLGHRRMPVVASMLYENLVVVCVFAATSCALLAVVGVGLPRPAWLLLAAAACAMLAALALPFTRQLLGAVARRIPRARAIADCGLDARSVMRASAVTLIAAALNGVAFALLLAAFDGLNGRELLVAAAAFNLAGAAGVAAVPVPSGIGVREAVLIALLQTIVPLEVATAAAILARAGGIAIDLVFGAAGAAFFALRARSGRRGVPASYSPSPLSSRPS
jgi:uncharacterized membrane protein YbhN (UPF0104 family)